MFFKMIGERAILTDIHPSSQYYKDKDILIGKEIEFGEDLTKFLLNFYPTWIVAKIKFISKIEELKISHDNRLILNDFTTMAGFRIKDFDLVTFLASL